MKEFFQTIFVDPFMSEYGVGPVLGVVMIISFLAIVVLITLGVLSIVDSVWLPTKTAKGKVIKKAVKKAYTTYMPIQIGKVTTYAPISHPETYYATIEIDGKTDEFFMGSYQELDELNDNLICHYSEGRIFGNNIYIHSIIKVQK